MKLSEYLLGLKKDYAHCRNQTPENDQNYHYFRTYYDFLEEKREKIHIRG